MVHGAAEDGAVSQHGPELAQLHFETRVPGEYSGCVGPSGNIEFARSPGRVGHIVIGVVHIQVHREHDLLEISHAFCSLDSFFGLGNRWEQHACKNGDDGDNDQQFNECECQPGHPAAAKGFMTDFHEWNGLT